MYRSYCICQGRWEQGKQTVQFLKRYPRALQSMALSGFPLLSAFLPVPTPHPNSNSQNSKNRLQQERGEDFSCHLQRSSSLRQTFQAVRQEAHCLARIPFLMRTSHTTEGRPAFPRVWPWGRGRNRGRNHPWLRLLPTAPPRPHHHFPKRGQAQALQLTGGSGFRASPSYFKSLHLTGERKYQPAASESTRRNIFFIGPWPKHENSCHLEAATKVLSHSGRSSVSLLSLKST